MATNTEVEDHRKKYAPVLNLVFKSMKDFSQILEFLELVLADKVISTNEVGLQSRGYYSRKIHDDRLGRTGGSHEHHVESVL